MALANSAEAVFGIPVELVVDEEANPLPALQGLRQRMEKLLAARECDIFWTGVPVVNEASVEVIRSDQKLIVPLTVMVMIVMLAQGPAAKRVQVAWQDIAKPAVLSVLTTAAGLACCGTHLVDGDGRG